MTKNKKTLQNQWYNGQEDITIKAHEYILFKTAVEQGIQSLVEVSYPEVKDYVNAETGEFIEAPTKEQLESGIAILTVNPEKTFSKDNRQISYNGKITQEMLAAGELSMMIHQRNIEQGVTTDVEELKKFFEEQKNASKLSVV